MVTRKQQVAPESIVGADVYTRNGKCVGRVVEVGERCLGLMLEGGPAVWLGRQAIEAISDAGVILTANVLYRHASPHDGLHVHGQSNAA